MQQKVVLFYKSFVSLLGQQLCVCGCCLFVVVVRVFSKSKPTQSKRQTQWQVWIWAVSSLFSPIQSNPNLFVKFWLCLKLLRNRRSWSSTQQRWWSMGRESGLAQGSIYCNIFGALFRAKAELKYWFRARLELEVRGQPKIVSTWRQITIRSISSRKYRQIGWCTDTVGLINPLPSHCSFIEDVYPWSLSPSNWAVLVVKLT